MPTPKSFYLPRYWQQFEDLTESAFQNVFGDPNPSKVGRPGQSQNGVDVYGNWSRNGDLIGIQCKRTDDLDPNGDPLPGGPITKNVLQEEYKKALKFRPNLKAWILATTARQDATAQEEARKLNAKSVKQGKFSVDVWFWDKFESYLNNYADMRHRYDDLEINTRTPQENNSEILEFYSYAFSRPAFHDPFPHEQREALVAAIRDTQYALMSGELLNRETMHVIRRTVGGLDCIQGDALLGKCQTVNIALQLLKETLRQGIIDGLIIEQDGFLKVIDKALEARLIEQRADCLSSVNSALESIGLPRVQPFR